MKFRFAFLALMLVFSAGPSVAQTIPTFSETQVGEPCTNSMHSTDFDTLTHCTSTDGTTGTMQKSPLFVGAVTSPPYAAITCDAGKKGMMQHTGTEMQYCDGTTWQILPTKEYVDAAGGGAPICDQPDAFSFTNMTSDIYSGGFTTDVVTLSGSNFTCPALVTCRGCSQIYRNAVITENEETIMSPGDTVKMYAPLPPGWSSPHVVSLQVGRTLGAFTITREASADCTADSAPSFCADGTWYLGLTPDGNVPMYGTTSQYVGKEKFSNGLTVIEDITHSVTGEANTAAFAALSNADSPYDAAIYCENLTAYGYSDWYLPATSESAVLGNIASVMGNSYFWLSRSNTATQGYASHAGGYSLTAYAKNSVISTFCIRK